MQDIQKYPTVTSLQLQQADPGLEKEKKSIYGHPLYPILSLLLEQCEQATASPDSQSPDTFEADLQSYILRNDNNEKYFFTDNKDLDSLMVKAIQVLRIHLIELRKVNELCRDFCSRYINCLKTKIQSDSMFDDSEESSPNGSERLSPSILTGAGSVYSSPYNSQTGLMGRNYLELTNNHRHQHMMNQIHNMEQNCNSTINGISVDCMDYMNGSNNSPPLSGMSLPDEITNNNYLSSLASGNSRYSNLLDPTKQKRGVLPKKATQIMKQWLFQHLVHPYPTEDEKRQIATQTNLTLLQVNNWFINARRRILQPMLDSSGSPGKDKSSNSLPNKQDKSDSVSESEDMSVGVIYNSSCGNRKKKAATNRPSNNRFWPASLAAAVNMLSCHASMSGCTSTSPMTTVASGHSTPKMVSQLDSQGISCSHYSEPSPSSNKRTKTSPPSTEIYQPPKLFIPNKHSYDNCMNDSDFKLRMKDETSSNQSTPLFTDLRSPNHSKSACIEDNERNKSELFTMSTPINSTAHSNKSTSPKTTNELKKTSKAAFFQSYFSSTKTTNPHSHELSTANLFPPNPCSYGSSNPYANMIMPQSNPYLAHSAVIYNASLHHAVTQGDPNSLFNIRPPNPHSFPIYDSMYTGYDNLIDKRTNMVSHINDLFTNPGTLNRSWEEQQGILNPIHRSHYNQLENSPYLPMKSEFMDRLPESNSVFNHSYSNIDTFSICHETCLLFQEQTRI
uniref:PREP homeodomain-like protein n=1 Tax=Schmidtea mediterranea TaxID=79327 RepID=D2Y165_SCHMD|nr:PREP homeodomain-like protein [Schmidtea mediterranea]